MIWQRDRRRCLISTTLEAGILPVEVVLRLLTIHFAVSSRLTDSLRDVAAGGQDGFADNGVVVIDLLCGVVGQVICVRDRDFPWAR